MTAIAARIANFAFEGLQNLSVDATRPAQATRVNLHEWPFLAF